MEPADSTAPNLAMQNSSGVLGQAWREKPSGMCVWLHFGKRQKPINSRLLEFKKRDSEKRSQRKSERSEDVRRGALKRRKRELAEGRPPGFIDWDAIDTNGDPLVSFAPGSALRRDLKRALKQTTGRDPARKRIVEKLGAQFARYYTRYRRAAEAKAGMMRDPYVMIESERAAAEVCAVNLIMKGVTPRELLEHWDKHISNFISNLAIPPLAFLKSPAAIDQVVCRQMDAGAKRKPERREQGVTDGNPRRRARPAGGNTFSDKGALDVGLRAALTGAGFDTNMLNDRYLLTVQYNACCLARGDEVFLSVKMRGMVEWLAENYVERRGLLEDV